MTGDDEVFGMWSAFMMLDEEEVVRCSVCGKRIAEDQVIYCLQCGVGLCADCEVDGMCPTCAELWQSDIDLADREAEEG